MSRYSSPHRDSYTSNLYTSSFPSAPHYSHSTSVSQPRESYPIISSQPIQSQYVVRHPEVIHQSIYHPQDNVKFYPSYSPETTYLTTAEPSEHVSPATDFHPTVYVQEPPVVFQHPVPQTYVYQSDPRPIITSGPIYENTVPVWRETVLPSESVRRNQDILELDRVVAEIRSRQARISDLQASARNIISERTQTLSYQRAFPEEAPLNSRSYTASTNYTNNYNDHRGYLDDSEFQDCETTHHRDDYDAPRVLKRNTIREERAKNSVQKPKAVTSAPSKATAKSAAKSPKLIAILGLAVVLFILAFYFMLF